MAGGIVFWMRNNVPVSVEFPLAEARNDALRDVGPIRRLVDASVLDGLTSIHRQRQPP